MAVVTIRDEQTGSTARILPDLGFNCFSFQAQVGGLTVEVLDAVPGFEAGGQRPSGSGIPILFPFPNRIRAGQFTWENREYVLPGTDKWGNAIHGFCLDRPWRVLEQGPNFVTGQFQLSVDAPDRLPLWPADFVLEVDYELLHNRLRANFRIINASQRHSLPWGLGTHPYFRLPLSPDSRWEDCVVEVPASHYWELQDCLPTGRILPVDETRDLQEGAYVNGLKLDDVLTEVACVGPQFEVLVMDERAGLQVVQTCPPIFREVVVFTPPNRQAICLEPYTCVTDAVNLAARGLDCGWRKLSPGGEFHTWIDLSVGPVFV
jgi:aldose 1-epimerase